MTRRAVIQGTGSACPEQVWTNDDVARMVDTSDEWIRQRTGIGRRHVAEDHVATSDLAVAAARRAIEAAGCEADDLDLILCCTMTPDHAIPATGALLQKALCTRNVGAYDIEAACSGFVFGLATGRAFVESGAADRVLVVGAETMSRILNWSDRTSCILFGDGAGAVVLGANESDDGRGILHSSLFSDGNDEVMVVPAGGSRKPADHEDLELQKNKVHIRGRETYKFAVSKMVELIELSLAETGHTQDEIDWVVPHQVNLRIIESAVKRLEIPMEKVVVNIDEYANTVGASVPLALDEAVRDGRIQEGHLVVMPAFGAGLTWGGALVRW